MKNQMWYTIRTCGTIKKAKDSKFKIWLQLLNITQEKKILINILYIFSGQQATFSSYAENLLNTYLTAAAHGHTLNSPLRK